MNRYLFVKYELWTFDVLYPLKRNSNIHNKNKKTHIYIYFCLKRMINFMKYSKKCTFGF